MLRLCGYPSLLLNKSADVGGSLVTTGGLMGGFAVVDIVPVAATAGENNEKEEGAAEAG